MIKLYGKELFFKTYPNNEQMIDLEASGLTNIMGNTEKTTLEFKYEDDRDLIKLLITKSYFGNLVPKLRIYYMPYSRADRSVNGSPFTLKYITDFINNMAFEEVEVIEPHSNVTCTLLNNSYPNNMTLTLLPKVICDLDMKPTHGLADDYLVFPDAGAQKRYGTLITDLPQIVAHKKRNFETGVIEGLELQGIKDMDIQVYKRALIVDDLSSRGGTFYYTAKALKEKGFKEVYLLVTHAEDTIYEGELVKDTSPINHIYTTDTILTKHEWPTYKRYENKFTIYKMEDILGGK